MSKKSRICFIAACSVSTSCKIARLLLFSFGGSSFWSWAQETISGLRCWSDISIHMRFLTGLFRWVPFELGHLLMLLVRKPARLSTVYWNKECPLHRYRREQISRIAWRFYWTRNRNTSQFAGRDYLAPLVDLINADAGKDIDIIIGYGWRGLPSGGKLRGGGTRGLRPTC